MAAELPSVVFLFKKKLTGVSLCHKDFKKHFAREIIKH